MNRNDKQTIIFGLLGACMVIVLLTLVVILGSIIVNGLPMLSWDFLTQSPEIDDTGAQTEGRHMGSAGGHHLPHAPGAGLRHSRWRPGDDIPGGVPGQVFLEPHPLDNHQ